MIFFKIFNGIWWTVAAIRFVNILLVRKKRLRIRYVIALVLAVMPRRRLRNIIKVNTSHLPRVFEARSWYWNRHQKVRFICRPPTKTGNDYTTMIIIFRIFVIFLIKSLSDTGAVPVVKLQNIAASVFRWLVHFLLTFDWHVRKALDGICLIVDVFWLS